MVWISMRARKKEIKRILNREEKFFVSFVKFEYFSLYYQFTQPFNVKWEEDEEKVNSKHHKNNIKITDWKFIAFVWIF